MKEISRVKNRGRSQPYLFLLLNTPTYQSKAFISYIAFLKEEDAKLAKREIESNISEQPCDSKIDALIDKSKESEDKETSKYPVSGLS